MTLSLVLALTCVAGLSTASYAAPSQSLFEKLNGRWTGWGWLQVKSGDRERIRCIVSYKLHAPKNAADQELRCASTSYIFDATASLKNDEGIISGTWKETTFAAEGTITGRATASFVSVHLEGVNLSAGMSITAKGSCAQTVRIRPQNGEITLMSISLKRC